MKREIIRAEVLGYCMGVRRAVEVAEQSITDYKDRKVFTFGPLIHNKTALESLENRGVGILKEHSIDDLNSDNPPVVIIRAHGVPPVIIKKLEDKNCTVIDATCPLVLANEKKAALWAERGYTIIIAGDKNHGEVAAVAGWAEHGAEILADECIKHGLHKNIDTKAQVCVLVGSVEDAACICEIEKAVLISQTTISKKEYKAIAEELSKHVKDLTVLETICPATKERQDALTRLCEQCDGILVVGGKNSANTQRLYMAAKEKCKVAAHIETADEIPQEFFALAKVGITAGSSTPDDVIDSVETALL